MIKFCFFAFFLIIATSSANASRVFLNGIFFNPDRMALTGGNALGLLTKYHFSSFRIDYRWRQIEKEKGVYKLPDADIGSFVSNSINQGITPLIILGSTTPLYGNTKPVSDEQISAFTHYAAWVVDQYPNQHLIYEIYNEWWNGDMKVNPQGEDSDSAKKYAALIKAVSKVIRQHNPHAIIIAGTLNPLSKRHVKWLDVMIREGVLNNVDGVSIHPYSSHSPDSDFSDIDKFEQHIRDLNNGKQVDLYITEMGYSNSFKGKLFPLQQERYIQKYFTLASSKAYIRGLWWYSLMDVDVPNSSYESNFGLLDKYGKEKKIMKGYLSWLKNRN